MSGYNVSFGKCFISDSVLKKKKLSGYKKVKVTEKDLYLV